MSRFGGSSDNTSQRKDEREDDDEFMSLFDNDDISPASEDEFELRIEAMECMPVLSDDVDPPEFDKKKLKKHWDRFDDDSNFLTKPVLNNILGVHQKLEVDDLLRRAFPVAAESDVPTGSMPEWVRANLNFEIGVTRVQNHPLAVFQNTFAELNKLTDEPRTMFHGTSEENVKHLVKTDPGLALALANYGARVSMFHPILCLHRSTPNRARKTKHSMSLCLIFMLETPLSGLKIL